MENERSVHLKGEERRKRTYRVVTVLVGCQPSTAVSDGAALVLRVVPANVARRICQYV
jgi:hypothetical protein